MSVLAGIGLGLQVYGNIRGNLDAAEEAERSAQWLREQEEFFRLATLHEKDVVSRSFKRLNANRAVAQAGNGVELSGSFIDMENQIELFKQIELDTIQMQGDMQIREAQLKAQGLENRADKLSSFGYNALTSGTIILGDKFGREMLGELGEGLGMAGSSIGTFLKNEYAKGVGRKAESDYHNMQSKLREQGATARRMFHSSILSGGGKF